MIQLNTQQVAKTHRYALGLRFYNAIKASTENPEKKKYYLDLLQREARNDVEEGHE